MAAPTFVGAGTGVVIQTGSLPVEHASGAVGDLLILHVLQNGVGAAGHVTIPTVNAGILSITGVPSTITQLKLRQQVGSTLAASQHLWVGRRAVTGTVALTVATAGDDLYCRLYAFRGVSSFAATLAGLLENVTAGNATNEFGSTAAITDTAVTTLGFDRLAVQFVGVDDDNPVAAFTGMSGGTWAEAVAEFASATGTDAAIQLQTATIASAGTINGGSQTMAAADNWGVIGFALIPAPVLEQEAYRFRNDDGNETTATWRQAINTPDTIALETPFRLRFAVENSGGPVAVPEYQVQYRRKPSGGAFGAWTNISASTPVSCSASSPHYSNTTTTQQISSGTFFVGDLRELVAVANFSFSPHPERTWTEAEFLLVAKAADGAANSDEYEFRFVHQIGSVVFDTYTRTPSLTIGAPSGTAHTATPADTLSLADSATTQAGKSATIGDTLAVADAVASQVAFARTVADPLSLTDSQAFQRDVVVPVTDTLSLADLAAAQRGIAQAVADTLALADSLTSAGAFQLAIVDTLTLADTLSSQAAFVRALADTLTLADLADPVKSVGGVDHTQPIADVLAIGDVLALSRGLSITDTLALADSLSSQAAFLRTVADTVTLTDSFISAEAGAQLIADTLAVTDALRFDRTLTLTDALTFADALTSQRAFARAITDTLTVADLLTVTRGITQQIADTLALADAFRFDRTLNPADTLALADTISFQAAYLRTLADTVTLTDAVTAGRQLAQALTDAFALTDSLTAESGLGLTLADTLFLADLLESLLGEQPLPGYINFGNSWSIDLSNIGLITRPAHGARVNADRGRTDNSTVGVLAQTTKGTP